MAYHGGQSFGRLSKRENCAGMTPIDDWFLEADATHDNDNAAAPRAMALNIRGAMVAKVEVMS